MDEPTQFYHVDRSRILQAGQVLTTMHIGMGAITKSRRFADSLTGGLSRFGFRHGLGWAFDDKMRPIGMQPPPNMHAEPLYEAIRVGFFPDRPSRFQAVFGCRTLEAARQFAAKYPGGSTQSEFAIWRVEATGFAELDLNLVNGHVTYPHTHDTAIDYWSGHHSRPRRCSRSSCSHLCASSTSWRTFPTPILCPRPIPDQATPRARVTSGHWPSWFKRWPALRAPRGLVYKQRLSWRIVSWPSNASPAPFASTATSPGY